MNVHANSYRSKAAFTILISILFAFQVIGQDTTSYYKNVVKFNIISPLVKAGMLSYERSIKPKFSIGVGLGTKLEGKLPKVYQNENQGLSIMRSGVSGTYFVLESKWYPKKCDCEAGMEGFYVAPYFRYNKYKMDADIEFEELDNSISVNKLDSKLRETGVGVLMGYQLMLWKRVAVDFLFFGPRTSSYKLTVDLDQDVSDEFLDALSETINETLDRILQKGGVDLTVEDAGVRSRFNWFNFRYAISVGYAF